MITTGGLPFELDRIPGNCFVEEFAPGCPLMERSDAVINHGGNGTVYQAIKAGVPIVGIPYHIDQEINLQRVQELGIGFMIREKGCSPSALVEALQAIQQTSSYRENMKELRSSLDQYTGPTLAARYIHEFLSA